MNLSDPRPSKPVVGGSIPSRRTTYPAPETTHAVLFCARGCGWTRHSFVGREPVHVVDKEGVAGRRILDRLIFADSAGHERVWGNEGAQS